jgi:hypothetical protein
MTLLPDVSEELRHFVVPASSKGKLSSNLNVHKDMGTYGGARPREVLPTAGEVSSKFDCLSP